MAAQTLRRQIQGVLVHGATANVVDKINLSRNGFFYTVPGVNDAARSVQPRSKRPRRPTIQLANINRTGEQRIVFIQNARFVQAGFCAGK